MANSKNDALSDRLDALLDKAESSSDDELARKPADLAQLSDAISSLFDDQLKAGTTLGNWEVCEQIAAGGMAMVYRVSRRDAELDQNAALKILPAHQQDQRARERLKRERQILADLTHPNIATLFDAGVTEHGQPWFVMEYVNGEDIVTYCDQGELDNVSRVKLATQVCKALAHAHQLGVVHRDIKPGNILVRKSDGELKLLDFGIARQKTDDHLTMTGAVIGTPGYMSPEQASGQHHTVDRRSDVFSLGILLYRLLVGKLPFEGDTTAEIIYKIFREQPSPMPSHIARDLRAIIDQCLRKAPDDRYPSASALLEDLQAFLGGRPVAARHTRLTQRLGYRIRRHPWTSASVFAAGIAIIGAISWGIFQSLETLRQVRAAERYSYLLQNIQHQVRRMHMMPTHDVQQGYQSIHNQIAAIEKQIESGKAENVGAAHYALGSAYMTMRQFRPAHEQFIRAQQAGWDTPEFRAAYGYAKFIAWENANRAAQRVEDTEAAQSQAKAEYYEPALALLESARDKVPLADFLQARIAHSTGDQEAAVDAAQRSITANPWHYESLKLASEAYMQQFLARGRQEGYGKALALFESSNAALDRALTIGRSDPYLVISRCSNASVEAQLYGQLQQFDKLSQALDNGIAVCEQATLLKADAYSPWVNINLMYATKGDWQEQTEQDPTETYHAAFSAGERAFAQYPEEGSIVTAMIKPAVKLAALTDDAPSWFDQSAEYADTAIAVAPESHRAWYEAARHHFQYGVYLGDQGEQTAAQESLKTALDQIARSHQLSQSIGSANFLGRVLKALVDPPVNMPPEEAAALLQRHLPNWIAALPSEPDYTLDFGHVAEMMQTWRNWQGLEAGAYPSPQLGQKLLQKWCGTTDQMPQSQAAADLLTWLHTAVATPSDWQEACHATQ